MSERILAVIPARLASTRLPRKVLREIAGEPMLAWVYRAARACPLLDQVLIATDSQEVLEFAQAHSLPAVFTPEDCASGTDRVYAVAQSIPADIYVNVQGDEPLLDPAAVDAAVTSLLEDPPASIATVATPIKMPADIMDPNVVKTVLDFEGNAIYFSRAPIPWVRDTGSKVLARHLKHLGLYVFDRESLLEYPTLPPGELERIEQLEQLRWLENGWKIRVAEVEHDAVSVDVPEDVARVEKLLQK